MRVHLSLFPALRSPFSGVDVALRRRADALTLDWRVSRASDLLLPSRAEPVRQDGLWRTTCFELFLKPGAGEAYVEFNFSPSGKWAAYHFDGFRRGMRNASVEPPKIVAGPAGRIFALSASIDLRPFVLTPSARLGLSAVLESKSGATSFWAAAHKGDKPDFHRADGFIARLPFESAP